MTRLLAYCLLTLVAAYAGSGHAAPAPSAILRSGFIYDSAPYPEAHASTLVQTAKGSILAAWFGGTKERNPDVSIYVARQEGGTWSTPRKVADGVQPDGSRYPSWNPVLFQPDQGPLMLFYKVGPNPREWWGMAMSSTDDGKSWSKPVRLAKDILGPIKNKPVTLPDGSWLSPSSTEADLDRWALHFERSTDQGRSWTRSAPVPSPEGLQAIQPSILFHPGNRLEAIARTRQGVLAMSWSKDSGRSWSPLAAIDLPNPNSGTDAVTLKDGRQLIVYNHSAHGAERPGKGPRYPLTIALSSDGVSWTRVLTLESAPLPAGYAYPAVIQDRDGLVHISYTYDRRRIKYVVVDPAKLPAGS